MKKIHIPSLVLAVLVITSFLAAAVAIGYRNYSLTGISMLIGFIFMFFGIKRKKRRLN